MSWEAFLKVHWGVIAAADFFTVEVLTHGGHLTDAEEGFLNGTRYLIHDRDPLFTTEFQEILESSGVKAVKLPARSLDRIACRERLGGLLGYYHRRVA